MQEKILNSSLKEYKLEIINADINIYSSNVPNPVIKSNGAFDIKDNVSILKIKQIFEKSKKGFDFRKVFGRQVITINGCKIIKRGNSVTVLGNGGNVSQINEKTFINGIEIAESMINYILSSNTVNGSSNQRTIEKFEVMPNLLDSKHRLNINNVNGDIEVIFKGKSKQR